jgi:hypothetical protein
MSDDTSSLDIPLDKLNIAKLSLASDRPPADQRLAENSTFLLLFSHGTQSDSRGTGAYANNLLGSDSINRFDRKWIHLERAGSDGTLSLLGLNESDQSTVHPILHLRP